jgi:hypothetical protein
MTGHFPRRKAIEESESIEMNAARTSFKDSLSNWGAALQGRFKAPRDAKVVEPFWILIAAGGVVALTASFLVASRGGYQIAREHGPMENIQAGFLLGALLLLGWQAWREKTAGVRIMRAMMAWGYFAFLILEFDVRPFEVKWLNVLLNGAPRNLLLILGSVTIASWAARHLSGVVAGFATWLSTFSATLLVVSAALWFTGAIIEHWGSLPKPTATFFEELLETNATWLMMLATVVRPRHFPVTGVQTANPHIGPSA